MNKFNQTGVIHIVLILLATTGFLLFLLISNTFNFRNRLFSNLFPKPPSHAATTTTLNFSTFLGGSSWEFMQGSFVDKNGYIYLAFATASTDFPVTAGAYDTTYNGGDDDAVVVKLSPDGSNIIWATFLGGNNGEWAHGIFVDNQGAVYVEGLTLSSNFPTTPGAYDRTYNGGDGDLFVAKISPNGSSLVYSTFMGGSAHDGGRAIIFVNPAGEAYLSGYTASPNFPTTAGAYQRILKGPEDAVIFKLSADGSTLLNSTYFGGSGYDTAYSGVRIHSNGTVYIAGYTNSADLPTTPSAYQRTYGGDSGTAYWMGDGYVANLSSDLSSLIFSTYLGGSGDEVITENFGMTIDSAGRIYVAGHTQSLDFPTTINAYQKTKRAPVSTSDQFVSILSADGSTLLASTYISGSNGAIASGIATDSLGNVYIGGSTYSNDYPTTADAFQRIYGGDEEAVVAKFSPDLSQLLYSTYLGGSAEDRIRSIAVDPSDNLITAGDTGSPNFPILNAIQLTYKAGDVFIAKFTQIIASPTPSPSPSPTPSPAPPNIVVIMTDDQDAASIQVMNKVKTLLSDKGITFTNSFVDNSLCCPSRATFLTGQASHNNGVFTNGPPDGGYGNLEPTLGNSVPVWLQQAGYDTAHIGKMPNGFTSTSPVPPGWNTFKGFTDPETYRYSNYQLNENGVLNTYNNCPDPDTNCPDYQTDVLSQKAVAYINSRSGNPQPFFLSVAPLAPHVEYPAQPNPLPRPAPRHLGTFGSIPLPTPPSFNEADVSDKPSFISSDPLMDAPTISYTQTSFQKRRESLLAVDDMVESIVNALQASGKLNDTVIIFTSDNGFFHGEHRQPATKLLLYEESIRVPLIIRGDGIGIPQGQTRSQMVNNVDIPATILELSRASAGRIIDGRSFAALFQNPGSLWRSALLTQAIDSPAPPVAKYKAVRTNRYIYGEHTFSSDGHLEKELYDVFTDPYQLISRHNDSSYSGVMSSLQSMLTTLATCAGTSCWMTLPEPPPPTKTGDLNGDGFVNVVDFSIMLSKWGTPDLGADLNGDGIVNVVDFSILLSNWGT